MPLAKVLVAAVPVWLMYATLIPLVKVLVAPETVSELLTFKLVEVALVRRTVPRVLDALFKFCRVEVPRAMIELAKSPVKVEVAPVAVN
jgi:hypothetical protein